MHISGEQSATLPVHFAQVNRDPSSSWPRDSLSNDCQRWGKGALVPKWLTVSVDAKKAQHVTSSWASGGRCEIVIDSWCIGSFVSWTLEELLWCWPASLVFDERERNALFNRVCHLSAIISRCKVFLWFYHALYHWKQYGILHFLNIFITSLPLGFENFENAWEVKNPNAKTISNGGL